MRPSRLPPILTVCHWARPWTKAVMFSVRDSVQRTGRPTRRARSASSSSSAVTPFLAPKLPPTWGTTTRTWSGSSP